MARTTSKRKKRNTVPGTNGREETYFEFHAVLQPKNNEPPYVAFATKDHRVRIRFESPEQIAETMIGLMEASRAVWPDHPLVQEYALEE